MRTFQYRPQGNPGLALAVALGISVASVANAAPRGSVLPRPVGATAPASRSFVPGELVGRPDSSCKPKKNLLAYHGGALVQHPRVFLLFWGTAWTSDPAHLSAKADLENLHQKIVTSEYACAWQEYSVPGQSLGLGTYAGSRVIASNPANPVTDASIRAKIAEEVALGHAPARTDDMVYVMVTPGGFPVDAGDGTTGCGGSHFGFCAYHWAFQSGGAFRYEVLPFPCNSGGFTCFVGPTDDVNSAYESSASHELAELVTDPDDPGGWYSDRDGQENADICAADACSYDMAVGLDTFVTNSTWSNLAGGCIGTLPCGASPIGCTHPAPGACSAGAGKSGACSLEWQVDPNLTQKKGIATGRVWCSDGLPFCDADGVSNGACTFRVAACMNNSDPRLPSCSLQPISVIELQRPALTNPVVPALLGALSTADPGAVGSMTGARLEFLTAASTANSCTSYQDVEVAIGQKLSLSATVTMATGHAMSRLLLTCR